MEDWIQKTIDTVLSQAGDFEIEYIVIDDGGKDTSAAIAEKCKAELEHGTRKIFCKGITMQVIRQENTGMYEAINRGFARATGDIYAWINADDLFEPGALDAMHAVFLKYPDIEWVKGISATIEEDGSRSREGHCRIYHRDWLANGIYGQEAYFVEQDSVFWRASLWKKIGGMPARYRSAADYWLWIQFAKHARLWSFDAKISCFRKRAGQISKGVAKYKAEQWDARPKRPVSSWPVRIFFASQAHVGSWSLPFYLALYPLVFRGSREYITPTYERKTMATYRILNHHNVL
jgi:glycosyltransferase involved in cell wall biosynthesis